jgi:hypothetical protein
VIAGSFDMGTMTGMRLGSYAASATWRRSWRMTLLIALMGGLLGSVALGVMPRRRGHRGHPGARIS